MNIRFYSILLISFSIIGFFGLDGFAQNSFSSPGKILAQLEQLQSKGKVLYVAAHPDDENTRLISYLVNEKHFRTAYLSLTRGDGGQNLIGNEQSEELGIIRTQELLAARRTDGAEQFFTRAFDFGYSKNPEETFRIWGKEQVLADVVLVIRHFKPDVIVTRFPTTGEGGHGHHTASAMLAQLAFDAAGDPKQFPESAKLYGAWKPKSLYYNSFKKFSDPNADMGGALRVDIGSFIPILGESVGEIASKSRSQHKSQGFGVALQRGEYFEYFDFLAGEKAQNSPFESISSGWEMQSVNDTIQKIIQSFNPLNPANSIPSLSRLYNRLKELPNEKKSEFHLHVLENILMNCAGFYAEFTAAKPSCFPGSTLPVSFNCINRSEANCKLISYKTFLSSSSSKQLNKSLNPNNLFNQKDTLVLPVAMTTSNPYWLENVHGKGLFTVNDLSRIGKPESDASISLEYQLEIGSCSFNRTIPLQYTWVDPVKGELKRRVEILPSTTAKVNQDLFVFNSPDKRFIEVTIETNLDTLSSELSLDLPTYLVCSNNNQKITLGKKSTSKQLYRFEVSVSPSRETKKDSVVDVRVMMGNGNTKNQFQTISIIDYDHIPLQTWVKPTVIKMTYVSMNRKGQKLLYIPGADDKVAACLKYAGYDLSIVQSSELTPEKLIGMDAVVVGIRAFNTNENMVAIMPYLLDFVRNGGTLIEQYNTKNRISELKAQPGPYSFEISNDRVTDENAEMKILVADHPIFNFPNKISQVDFSNWIQERGIYFPNKWDSKYTPLLECNDPNEKPLQGALLAAEYGKGKFIYTGLSFFRELPAGVPGAYRLFANMIAWSKYDGKE
jgi:LmbE family N-acetylglucosaminyl deacetylase